MAHMNINCTSSESVTGIVKGSHEFKLKGYSLVKGIGVGRFIASETFNVGGYEWAIHFYPDGIDTHEHATVYVSVYVALLSEADDVRAKFELSMLDQRGEGVDFVLGHFNGTLGTKPHILSTGDMWFVSSIVVLTFSFICFFCIIMFYYDVVFVFLGGLIVITNAFTLNTQRTSKMIVFN